jgi:hypothetical protein
MTAYHPENSRLEGGLLDRFGNKLNTLQDFLYRNAPYVTVARDIPLSNGTGDLSESQN